VSAKNQTYWEATSDAYQAVHGAALQREPLAWGVWRIPEAELGVLGPLDGRDVLELGCGAAQWTLALRARGVHAVGLDASWRQLAHARQVSRGAALVLGTAEALPFCSGCFDVVFCDHGAMTFASPDRTVPEAARVLRPDGLLAFCMATPILDVCDDTRVNQVLPHLVNDYFTLSAYDDGHSVTYQRPYGEWIRLFRQHGLIVEDLVELQAPPSAKTTYADFVSHAWARRWPAEHIWKVRKAA
jgi:SAM-dependent methyltransferase